MIYDVLMCRMGRDLLFEFANEVLVLLFVDRCNWFVDKLCCSY